MERGLKSVFLIAVLTIFAAGCAEPSVTEPRTTPSLSVTPTDNVMLIEGIQEITITGLTGEMQWSANGEVTKSPKAVVIENGVYVGM